MASNPKIMLHDSAFAAACMRRPGRTAAWWSLRREASLNWLALGLLLAAWNASDNDPPQQIRARPESLRGYSYVSVRAAHLVSIN